MTRRKEFDDSILLVHPLSATDAKRSTRRREGGEGYPRFRVRSYEANIALCLLTFASDASLHEIIRAHTHNEIETLTLHKRNQGWRGKSKLEKVFIYPLGRTREGVRRK
ncbi:hypothetical protein TNIN_246571 [Trichonephila inaurata madagascariensis]|uniref:Uncharacterized protein n=1 Tax=Trichonephila inaurata madagascariensis TaxID=2747483 RepID=A0A8X7CBK7_9ARAC|nr:hypothetical protein TNIN_246571 [Trichonephila inaurata madagascariensis]